MRSFAFSLLLIYSFEILAPTAALALTAGPTAPEMHGFAPVEATQMVDAFTGDFSYNIPLMDVGGYPINLSYQAGSGMEDEASWVGLGWTLSPGVINRQLRGLPDDFNGEYITSEFTMKESFTAGLTVSGTIEALGFDLSNVGSDGVNLNVGIFYNNYNGFGLEVSPSLAVKLGDQNQPKGEVYLGLDLNSQDGLSAGLGGNIHSKNNKMSYGLDVGYSSRGGLKEITLQTKYEPDELPFGLRKSMYNMGQGRNKIIIGAPISFSGFSQPTVPDHEVNTTGLTLTGAPGGEAKWFGFIGKAQGYYSKQNVKENIREFKSYGYLYENGGRNDEEAMLDVTREKDVPFIKSSVNIGVPYKTFDLFTISGQGVAGQFRFVQNDVGVTFEPKLVCNSNTLNVGVEGTAGDLGKVGVDILDCNIRTKSKKWTTGNNFGIKTPTLNQSGTAEAIYAKSNTDVTINPNAEDYIAKLGGYKPVRTELYGMQATSNLIESGAGPLTKHARDQRKQHITVLTGEESRRFGYHRKVRSYTINTLKPTYCPSDVVGGLHKSSSPQIGEIIVTQPDGTRYVYGQPVYNKSQIEATFSVDGTVYNHLYVTYTPDTDNDLDNDKGLDHYFSAQSTPQYPYAWLLTEILPADYVDLTGNGVSPDDLGNYTQFNYSKLDYDIHWRTPFATMTSTGWKYDNIASYQPESRTTSNDDKGSYVYGVKETWYLHSIETPAMYAQFYLNDNASNPRNDGLGVNDENGGLNIDNRLRYLEKVSLFSKGDLKQNGVNAVPIQTCHFTYDYTLCAGVPNSLGGNGKLTLKSIHFTYGKNTRGQHNKYKFTYNSNPPYQQDAVDRWGNYCLYPGGVYPNRNEYSYTYQNMATAKSSAEAWNLSKIILPSAAEINILYEPDDYAYIQNKRAHVMYRVNGFCADGTTSTPTDDIYNATSTDIGDIKEWIEIQVTEDLTNYDNADIVREFFDNDLSNFQLYFHAKLLMDPNHANQYDVVTGYGRVLEVQKVPGTNKIRLKLKTHSANNKEINPVVFAGLNYIRTSLPKVANLSADAQDGAGEQVIMSLLSMVAEIPKVLLGIFKVLLHRNCCSKIKSDESWVRLQDPNYSKFGGGHRVKMVTMSDSWSTMDSNEPSAVYGKYYQYNTVLDPLDPENPNDDVMITSGVASYEPLIGGDENPFRQSLSYEEKVALAANRYYYVEAPLGESLFPGPAVGYSQIKSTDVTPETHLLITSALASASTDWSQYSTYAAPLSGTGYTLQEFYTAKEFPTEYRHTDLYFHHLPTLPLAVFPLNILQFEKASASQGFYIETNDMHGREKKTSVYDNNRAIVEYTYTRYTETDNAMGSNVVNVIHPDGSTGTKTMGVLVDVYQDMRHSRVNSITAGIELQLDISLLVPPIPLPIPMGWPNFQKFTKEFKSSATTKFVHRNGIPAYVETFKNGSTVRQENLYYDALTGDVLVTQTTNEFNEPLHTFTYPAHWAYSGMGPAYLNDGAVVDATITNGVISSSSLFALHPGDEVYLMDQDNTFLSLPKYYVAKPQGSLVIMSREGYLFDSGGQTVRLKIIRSGHRNHLNAKVGGLTSLYSPLQNRIEDGGVTSSTFANLTSKEFIDAQANQFSDEFIPIKCNLSLSESCPGEEYDYGKLNASIYDALRHNQQYNTVYSDFKSVWDVYTAAGFNSPIFDEIGNPVTLNYWQIYRTEPSTPIPLGSLVPDNKYVAQFGAIQLVIEGVFDANAPGGQWSWGFEPPYYYHTGNGKIYKDDYNVSVPDVHVATIKIVDPTGGDCTYACVPLDDQVINPYAKGIRGVWRPMNNYVYYGDRTPGSSTGSRINEQGTIKDFEPFWTYNATTNRWEVAGNVDGNPWSWNTKVTRYDSKGNATEEKNALGVYSSALFENKNVLTSAVSANARHREIAFDSFEDYIYAVCDESGCIADHWNARDVLAADPPVTTAGLSSAQAHSGRQSLKVPAGAEVTVTRDVFDDSGAPLTTDNNQFYLATANCQDLFNPMPEKKYLITAWVKEDGSAAATYTGNAIEVYNGALPATSLQPSGPIIEGWQRYEALIDLPSNATMLSITFKATGSQDVFFDDVRIHPYDANMKSFVYDSRTLRLMATLDENNYATFYEYDDQGNLVRTKKETERGIVTLQESLQILRSND